MSKPEVAKEVKVSSMEKFKIHAQAQVPQKVLLNDPATDEATDDFLMVRSSMSDAFLEARDRIMQEVQSISEPNPKARAQIVKDLQLQLKVALVAGWSFDEEFNQGSLTEFLKQAPQVQEMLMRVADDAARFFGTASRP